MAATLLLRHLEAYDLDPLVGCDAPPCCEEAGYGRLLVYLPVGCIGFLIIFFSCLANFVQPKAIKLAEEGIDDAKAQEVKDKAAVAQKAIKADYETARAWCRSNAAGCRLDGRWRSVFRTRISDIDAIGGVGLGMYFRFLISMCGMFLLISAFSMPHLAFNAAGSVLSEKEPDAPALADTTNGNLADDTPGIRPTLQVGCRVIPVDDLAPIISWLDALSMFLLSCFVFAWLFQFIPAMDAEIEARSITPSDFAIEVFGLPRRIDDHANYEAKLLAHFQSLSQEVDKNSGGCFSCCKKRMEPSDCKVEECSLVRDFKGRILTFKTQAELRKKLRVEEEKVSENLVSAQDAEKAVSSLKTQISKLVDKAASTAVKETDADVLRAFIVFDKKQEKEKVLHHYRWARYRLFRCFQSKVLRFEGSALRVDVADEPSNILWENADAGWKERLLRRFIIFIACLGMLGVSFFIIYFANTQKENAAGSGGATCTLENEEPRYSILDLGSLANATATKMTDGVDPVLCYCESLGQKVVFDAKEDDPATWDACEDWFYNTVTAIAIVSFSSVVVAGMNVVLKLVLTIFARKVRPASVSELEATTMMLVFIATYVNTALIVVILNYRHHGADFGVLWYVDVGAPLCLTLIVNAFSASISQVVVLWVKKVQQCCCKTRKVHMQELLDLLTYPEFNLSLRFSMALNAIWCTLTFSAGMPILNLICVVYLLISYVSDKYTLLRGSCNPPQYDTKIPKQALYLCFVAIVLHLLVSVWIFGNNKTFPSEPLFADYAADYVDGDGLATKIMTRAFRQSTLPTVLLLVLVVGTMVAKFVIGFVLGNSIGDALACIWRCVRCRNSEKVQDVDLALNTTFGESKGKMRGVTTYKLRDNPKYQRLVEAMDKTVDEKCSPKGTPVEQMEAGAAGPVA